MSTAVGQMVVAMPPARPQPAGRLTQPLSLRRITSLTLALLLVTAGSAGFGIYSVVQNGSPQKQLVAWSACSMLVFLALAVLLIGKYVSQRFLLHIEHQLQILRREDRLESVASPVPEDLGRVMAALSDYVDYVRSRLDRLNLQKKELDVQMRIADAERRNTEAVIRSISDAVLVIDPFGELILANTAAERLFNFRLDDCRHRPIERVLDDSSLVALIKDARAADEHGSRRRVEYGAVRDGRTQTFNITLSTVVDGDGQTRGVVAVFHDITHEREIAQIKTDFVASVSHELRTPLSSIKAYLEMLVDGEARDEATRGKFYRIMESETERLQRLISNILNISRIESGVVEVQRAVIQANQVVKDVMDMMKPQADAKDVALTLELGEHLPAILADRDMLHQAVLNVVGNAVKYTKAGGHVRVQTRADERGRSLSITVADNGVGIRAEHLSRVFEKFYRVRDSAVMAKGTGLGLSLVKEIVERVHHGEISIASELGAGTTVVLRLPFLMD